MTISEVKQALGSWSVRLRSDTPREALDALTYFGHIAVLPGRQSIATLGDNMLAAARYVGVLTGRSDDDDIELTGSGMPYWLGDGEDKGYVIETAINFAAETFANTVRDLLPPSVVEGTLHAVAGTYTGQHQWQTPRTAISYVTSSFDAEWRVNGDGTLDAGEVEDLYVTDPVTILVKKNVGRDLTLNGIQGDMALATDVQDYTTRVVLLAEGEGASIATGDADAVLVPYKDLFGNDVVITRMVSESETSNGNAHARAQLALNRFSGKRQAVTLNADEYDIKGDFVVGDYVYVYDPDTGFVEPTNEVQFRGTVLNPMALRVIEMSYPVEAGWTVAFRDIDGNWFDLSDYYITESGQSQIVVGDFNQSLSGIGSQPVGSRPNGDSSVPDAPSLNTPFTTTSYQSSNGETKARILVSWDLPLNTDGSTILDGDYYEIRYRVTGTTDYQYQSVAFDQTNYLLQELTCGVSYDISVRAVDLNGNKGAFSTTAATVASSDSVAPSTPAPPTVAGSTLQIQVAHSLGKSTGGTFNLESDLHHLNVHVGTSSGFTPSAANYVGAIAANAGNLLQSVAVFGNFPIADATTRWVKVIAVDASGNASAASSAASVTAVLIDTANIADLAVTNAKINDLTVSKITAGTISSNWILGANISTATSGARVQLKPSGMEAYDTGGNKTVDIKSSDGSVNIIGAFQTGVAGHQRMVMNPEEPWSTLYFYPSSGGDFAFVNFVDPGSGAAEIFGFNSAQFTNSVTGHTNRSNMRLGAHISLYQYRSSTQAIEGNYLYMDENLCYLSHLTSASPGVSDATLRLSANSASLVVDGESSLLLSSTGAHLSVDGGGQLRIDNSVVMIAGTWPGFVSADPDDALFVCELLFSSGSSGGSATYGATMSSTMSPTVTIQDSNSWSLDSSTFTGFAFSWAGTGSHEVHIASWRIP